MGEIKGRIGLEPGLLRERGKKGGALMKKKIGKELMEMADEVFWEEFQSLEEQEDQRYAVVDSKTGEVIITGLRLIKEKKKVEV